MLQTIIEFIGKLWSRGQSDALNKLKQAEVVVELSMKMLQSQQQQIDKLTLRMDARDAELDDLKAKYHKALGTIGDMQRRLDASEDKSRQDERTIAQLKLRIEELEAKQNG